MTATTSIALIDDDRDWADALAEYLRARGYVVRTAPDGTRGLALLEEGGIPLAVVDLNMPGMDGLELLRQLRRRRRPVAVILISADDDPTLPDRVKAEGGLACLSKTASPRLLLAAIRQALERPPSERPRNRLDQPWNRLLPGPRSRPRWNASETAAP